MKFNKESSEGVLRFTSELKGVVAHIDKLTQTGEEDDALAVLHLSTMTNSCKDCDETECQNHGKEGFENGKIGLVAGFIGESKHISAMVSEIASKDPEVFKSILRGLSVAARKNEKLKLFMLLENVML